MGQEESSYQPPLGITYPFFAPDTLVVRAGVSFGQWRELKPVQRAALLTEALDGIILEQFTSE